MQVFKLYFKILRKHLRVFIMYTAIFMSIAILVSQQAGKNEKKGYISHSCKFSYFDYDKSDAAGYLIDFLKEKNKCVDIKKDDKQTIQDELYNRNTDSVLRIKEGFEEALGDGDISEYLEIDSIPSTQTSKVLESQINGYMKLFDSYIQSGCSIEEAAKAATDVSQISADVTMLTEDGNKNHSKLYFFFLYCAYVFITMAVIAVGSIILIMNGKEVQNRVQCSSYKFSSYYKEVFLGIFVTGVMIVAVYYLLAFAINGTDVFSLKGLLHVLNMVCMMIVSLTIAFFATQIAKNEQSLDMIANVIGLGFSFLSGIFVPAEALGDNVIRIAHFLPSYWYALACDSIDFYKDSSQLGEIFKCFGIELLFAFAFAAVALALVRRKKVDA